MQEKPKVEDLIAESMTILLNRSKNLAKGERLAITQEYKEWLNGNCKLEDVLIIDTRIK